MGKTTIEWCSFTFNPWIGCTQVSPACDRCYAMVMMDHRYGRVRWGAGEDRVRTSAANWALPLRWNRQAAADGARPFVFCASLADVFDNEVPREWRTDLFSLIQRTPSLIWLLLSKRIGNAIRMCADLPFLPRNAALGATMVNQEEWDRDLPKLKEAGRVLGAKFTFASIEPMLGPVILDRNAPDWIICGGESGHGARAMNPQWSRDLRDGSQRFARAFFMKQIGSNSGLPGVTGKGDNPEQWPRDLMVRQFPAIQKNPDGLS